MTKKKEKKKPQNPENETTTKMNKNKNPETKIVQREHTSFFKRARIPGRTCLASTTSKGGKSKSWRRGLFSMDSSIGREEERRVAEQEKEECERKEVGLVMVDLCKVWRQRENEEDQSGQG